LSDYNLTEKGFIVLMIVKPKPKPAEAPKPATEEPKAETSTEPASATAAATETTPAPATTPAVSQTTSESTPAATPAAAPATTTPTTTPTTPAAPANPFSDELINNITVMGFPRDQVVAALRAAFGNPDRAVEYLMNGIPEHLTREQTPAPAAQAAAPAAAAPTTTPSSNPTATSNMSTFDRIRQEPQFQQIRQIIRTNPHLLEQFIQQMSRENPELFRDITAHQEEFIQMLNEDADDAAAGGAPTGAQGAQLGGAGGPTITREQDGRVTLQVTEAERQAIDRLKQLGFPEDMVVQAYFACDKNEELAANFLLSNAFD